MTDAAAVIPVLSEYRYGLLWGLVLAVLVLPFVIREVEHNLEVFLLAVGGIAVTVSQAWSGHLVHEALREPVVITLAVLGAGLAFHYGRRPLDRWLAAAIKAVPLPVFFFLAVAGLGLLSSVITAIIAALVLVEVVTALKLDRQTEIRLTVLACSSIGLGAALTPVGEPLSTIVVARMHGDFWYLARLLGWYIIPGVLGFGLLAALIRPRKGRNTLKDTDRRETGVAVWVRAGKVYLFVAALLLLGTGLSPLVDRFIVKLPAAGLFWVNMISAILDNATLAAAEVGPSLETAQVIAVLLGLLISGGMLIPGNIPNIVSAGHLKIGSREWARVGVPVGLVVMTVYFLVWLGVH